MGPKERTIRKKGSYDWPQNDQHCQQPALLKRAVKIIWAYGNTVQLDGFQIIGRHAIWGLSATVGHLKALTERYWGLWGCFAVDQEIVC